jgi:hypothetical protein
VNLALSKVVDGRGNPLDVSGIVSFIIVDSKKAAIDIANYREYIANQALAVMKSVCSKYPYESPEGKVHETSLRGETDQVK